MLHSKCALNVYFIYHQKCYKNCTDCGTCALLLIMLIVTAVLFGLNLCNSTGCNGFLVEFLTTILTTNNWKASGEKLPMSIHVMVFYHINHLLIGR